MNELETVKVKHKDGGYMIINKRDFDKAIHEEYKETNQDLHKMNKDVVPESQEQDEQIEEAPKEEPKAEVVKQLRKRVAKKNETDRRK